MEAVALDPDGYGGTYKFVAGRLAFDFINTVSWPGTSREHDWLAQPANVVRWLSAAGLETPPMKSAGVPDVQALREVVNNTLRPLASGLNPSQGAIRAFNQRLTRTLERRIVDPDTLSWSWKRSRNTLDLFDPVVLDAADIVVSDSRERYRACPACAWLFEDQTRNGRRRWCDMADCGSRAKSREYYHRQNPGSKHTASHKTRLPQT